MPTPLTKMEYSPKTLGQFKLDYIHSGKYNLEVQVPHLAKLAEFYLQKYKASQDWTDCIKAHALYNSISTRKPQFIGWKKRVFGVQELYCNGYPSLSFQQQQTLTIKLKARLRAIRTQTLSDVQAAEALVKDFDSQSVTKELHERFFNRLRDVSINCSQSMAEFAHQIIQECVDILKPTKPPCDFTVVTIGSMARGEATPYSDMEYFFLVEEKSLETIAYFERLAITSYIQIGNLGETKLSYMSIKELYGWFDDQAKNGFKIDGLSEKAGNIPTGNGSPCKRNQFIVTPQILAKRYGMILDNPDKETALRGDLTAMLAYMKPIYTHEAEGKDLLMELKSLIQCHSMNQIRHKMNLDMLKADVGKFNFKPDYKLIEKGFATDVKREIFRFPSILHLDITILTQTVACTSWESITTLRENEEISVLLHSILQLLLAAAAYMRLSTYLYHDSQDDRMSVAHEITPGEPSASRQLQSQCRWFVPNGLFITMCSKMTLLKRRLAENINIAEDLKSLAFGDGQDELWLQIPTLYFTGRDREIIDALQQRYGESLLDDPLPLTQNIAQGSSELETLYIIAESMYRCGEYRAALVLFRHKAGTCGLHAAGKKMADCYKGLGDYDRAIATLKTFPSECEASLFLMGDVHFGRKEYEKSEQSYLQVLEISFSEVSTEKQYDYYGDPIETDDQTDTQKASLLTITSPEERLGRIVRSSPDVIACLASLGCVYASQGKGLLAEAYLQRSLSLMSELYGEGAATPNAGATLCNLANNYRQMGRHHEARDNYFESLAIYGKLSHGADSIHIADILFNMGLNCYDTRQFDVSNHFLVWAWSLYDKLSRGADQSNIILHSRCNSLKNHFAPIGLTLHELVDFYLF